MWNGKCRGVARVASPCRVQSTEPRRATGRIFFTAKHPNTEMLLSKPPFGCKRRHVAGQPPSQARCSKGNENVGRTPMPLLDPSTRNGETAPWAQDRVHRLMNRLLAESPIGKIEPHATHRMPHTTHQTPHTTRHTTLRTPHHTPHTAHQTPNTAHHTTHHIAHSSQLAARRPQLAAHSSQLKAFAHARAHTGRRWEG